MTGSPPSLSAGRSAATPKTSAIDDAHAYDEQRHGPLRARITTELERVMTAAYANTP